MIGFQSLVSGLRPCPSGTFENSQQHARVIYGWVRRPLKTQSPAGTTENSFCHAIGTIAAKPFCSSRQNLSVAVSLWRKTSKLRNEPNFPRKLLSIKKKRRKIFYDKQDS
jgi:hypothetical protein